MKIVYADFAYGIPHLASFAFVPANGDDVVAAFEALRDADVVPAEAQSVVDYFKDTWIGRPHRRGRRGVPPYFRF